MKCVSEWAMPSEDGLRWWGSVANGCPGDLARATWPADHLDTSLVERILPLPEPVFQPLHNVFAISASVDHFRCSAIQIWCPLHSEHRHCRPTEHNRAKRARVPGHEEVAALCRTQRPEQRPDPTVLSIPGPHGPYRQRCPSRGQWMPVAVQEQEVELFHCRRGVYLRPCT